MVDTLVNLAKLCCNADHASRLDYRPSRSTRDYAIEVEVYYDPGESSALFTNKMDAFRWQ
jgi:hypothetical protein